MHLIKNILQWNLNSLKTKRTRLESLILNYNTNIIALQETKNPTNKEIKIRGYKTYQKDRDAKGGGVLLAIHENIPSTSLNIVTNLEVVACTVYYDNETINICNIYFPEHAVVDSDTLYDLLNAIPSPKLILGDINAKHPSWGSPITCPRGILLTDILLDHELVILNDNSPTRYDKNRNTYSHIDISCSSISIADKFNWRVLESSYGSDHFPILLTNSLTEMYTTKPIKYKLKEANWSEYSQRTTLPDTYDDANTDCTTIVETILGIAKETIPTTNPNVNTKYNAIWWRDSCKTVLDNVNNQFNILKRRHTPQDIIEYNRLEAIATQELLDAKRTSWQNYLGKVNRNTNLGEVFKIIKSLSGKNNHIHKIVLQYNGICSNPTELVRIFGQFYAGVCSTENYSREFIVYKNRIEQHVISFPPDNNQYYNSLFTIKELEFAIKVTKSSSPGTDGIHYEMLSKLSYLQKINLLNFYNHLWTNNLFPDQWREAVVIPFLKPGKPSNNVSSYRPIALTSCLCKTMERMVLPRLTLVLECNNYIKKFQSGFRRLHSTIDSLVRLESAIQETFRNFEYMIAVFLDIEKAYDMLWKYAISKALAKLKLVGNLPKFIVNFLYNRSIRVRIGDILSEAFLLENGIPQGSVLSCLLFLMITR